MQLLKTLRKFKSKLVSSATRTEPMMYRPHLFQDLIDVSPPDHFSSQRILEIGPKDGRDTERLASLKPSELVLIDLPEKRVGNEKWLPEIQVPYRYVEGNFLYLSQAEFEALGRFTLIWCTGVLYHNAEQLRLLRKLCVLLNVGGFLVLESATLRDAKGLRDGAFVEIHFPQTYRDTGTITHLPTRGAIDAWLQMVGFSEIHPSDCHRRDRAGLEKERYACIARKMGEDDASGYYMKSGLNPVFRFGEST